MFGNLPLCIIQFPSGRYGFVGTIPTVLGAEVPATKSDVMGGRSHYATDGSLVAWKFPSFASAVEAYDYALAKGCRAQIS